MITIHRDRREVTFVFGMGLRGYLTATYDELVAAFGQPLPPSPNGKVKAEWMLSDGATIATVYDYRSGVSPRRNTEWHVGGTDGANAVVAATLGVNVRNAR